ncbi:MAG: type VI secretion system protein [Deltaproteobacteria bacterium]|nr:type VI secretion system protein [Deltaproteobacteria bacterium]
MPLPATAAQAAHGLRSPAGLATLLLAALLGLVGGQVPLLEVPGWELGMAAALLLAAPAIALGAGAARREGALPGPSALRAAGAALAPLLLALLLLFALSVARAALATPCRPTGDPALFALTALPAAALGAALGLASAVAARGRRLRAALLAAGVALAALAASAARAYLGPGSGVWNHLLGFWPGPIYDDLLDVSRPLLLFRASTMGWAAALVAGAALVWRRRQGRPAIPALAALAGALLLALLPARGGGWEPSRADVARALGGARDGPRCHLRFPAEWSPARAERLQRDCEASAFQVAARLGIADPPPVEVFVHRSPAEKRLLTGAGRTSFTKPWLAQIQVNDEPSPRPVLRHELVHALAASFAPGPFRVPARGLVRVRAGLVEGLASALEPPRGDGTAHEWAAALRRLGRLPPPDALLGDAAFLGAAPERAYAAAGSLVAFLLERHGAAAVRALYRSGEPQDALGLSPGALAREWEAFLDGVPVPPDLQAAAEQRFRAGSLFETACAREQASLRAEARAEGGAAPERAEAALRRVAVLSGGDPDPLRLAADLWRDRRPERARALAEEALARAGAAGGQPALRAGLLTVLGDLALAGGDAPAAAAHYGEALPLSPTGAERRALEARLAAAGDPGLAEVLPWLLGRGGVAEARQALRGSRAPLARYLLARAELARGAPRAAREALASLDPAALPGPELAAEAARLAAEARCSAGDFEAGVAAWQRLAAGAARASERERAADAAERCAFEGRTSGPPPPDAGGP